MRLCGTRMRLLMIIILLQAPVHAHWLQNAWNFVSGRSIAWRTDDTKVQIQMGPFVSPKDTSKEGHLDLLWVIPDTEAVVGKLFRFVIPNNAFQGDVGTINVRSAGGDLVPKWLYFNSSNQVLYGVPAPLDQGNFLLEAEACERKKSPDDAKPNDSSVSAAFLVKVHPANQVHPSLSHDHPRLKQNECKWDEDIVRATLLLDATLEALEPKKRVKLLYKAAKFLQKSVHALSLLPKTTKLAAKLMDTHVLVAGPGNGGIHGDQAGIEMSWIIGCGDFDQVNEVSMVMDHNIKSGRLVAELEYNIIGWFVAKTMLPESIRKFRRKRNAPLHTLMPTATVQTMALPSILHADSSSPVTSILSSSAEVLIQPTPTMESSMVASQSSVLSQSDSVSVSLLPSIRPNIETSVPSAVTSSVEPSFSTMASSSNVVPEFSMSSSLTVTPQLDRTIGMSVAVTDDLLSSSFYSSISSVHVFPAESSTSSFQVLTSSSPTVTLLQNDTAQDDVSRSAEALSNFSGTTSLLGKVTHLFSHSTEQPSSSAESGEISTLTNLPLSETEITPPGSNPDLDQSGSNISDSLTAGSNVGPSIDFTVQGALTTRNSVSDILSSVTLKDFSNLSHFASINTNSVILPTNNVLPKSTSANNQFTSQPPTIRRSTSVIAMQSDTTSNIRTSLFIVDVTTSVNFVKRKTTAPVHLALLEATTTAANLDKILTSKSNIAMTNQLGNGQILTSLGPRRTARGIIRTSKPSSHSETTWDSSLRTREINTEFQLTTMQDSATSKEPNSSLSTVPQDHKQMTEALEHRSTVASRAIEAGEPTSATTQKPTFTTTDVASSIARGTNKTPVVRRTREVNTRETTAQAPATSVSPILSMVTEEGLSKSGPAAASVPNSPTTAKVNSLTLTSKATSLGMTSGVTPEEKRDPEVFTADSIAFTVARHPVVSSGRMFERMVQSSATTGVSAPALLEVTAQPNQPPRLVNPMKKLSTFLGIYYEFRIPVDTFYDFEDGNTRNLHLRLLDSDRQPLGPQSWVMFDNASQVIYGLPLDHKLISNPVVFIVQAIDSGGLERLDTIEISIDNSTVDNISYNFVAEFELDFKTFLSSTEALIDLVLKIGGFYGDVRSQHLTVTGVENGSVVVKWTNNTVSKSVCQMAAILNLYDRMFENDEISRSFIISLLPGFPIKNVTYELLGVCLSADAADMPTTEVGPTSELNILLVTVIPAVLIAALIILFAILWCIFCKRHNTSAMFLLEDEKVIFKKNRKPIFMDGELELKDVINRPRKPVVMERDRNPYDFTNQAYIPSDDRCEPPSYHVPVDGGLGPLFDHPDFVMSTPAVLQPPHPPDIYDSPRDDDSQDTPPPPYRLPPSYVPPDTFYLSFPGSTDV